MRRSPRLHETTNDASSRTGNGTRPPHGPALQQPLPLPHTPQHLKTGAALDHLVNSLEEQWRLGLPKDRSQVRSPAPLVKTTVDKTYDKIKLLFYSKRPALDDVIKDFEKAAPGFSASTRLDLLDGMLRSRVPTPASRAGTPGARNVPPKSLLTSRPTTPSTTFLRRDGTSSYYTTANENESSTEEEDAFETPSSPTPSSRRKQVSPPLVRSNPRKRPSDSSNDGTSPKLTRTARGKQTAEYIQPDDKSKQSGSMMPPPRLLHTATATVISSNTSSANTSFNASQSSSQQTTADTVNTSFTSIDSYDGANDQDSKMTRTSSTTMGFLEDRDFMHIATRLEGEAKALTYGSSQDGTRGCTSTYGSIDEMELMTTTATIEDVATTPMPFTEFLLSSPSTVHRKSPLGASTAAVPSPARSCLDCGAPPWLDGAASDPSPDKESPSRIAYYIRDLPTQDLFVPRLSRKLEVYPYHVLFACCRISEATGVPMTNLLQGLDPMAAENDENKFWTKLEEHPKVSKISPREPKAFWSAARRSCEGYSFKGKLVFNSTFATSKTVFKLELLPVQAEISCQLQRQFGSDRFLYLTVPSLDKAKPDRFGHREMQDIRESFSLWLLETHSFLGRKWRVFHIQPIKKKSETSRDDTADIRLILFAVEGHGIQRPLPIGNMLNEFIPFKDNKGQNFCKALARVDLGLSKTTPTLTFRPSQIRRIRDTFSDGTPEATEFNDPRLSWKEKPDGPQVMNDGCSRISVAAALSIWKQYQKVTECKDPFPSAMQGRIGGAKGMWIISGEPQSRKPEDGDNWIEVTDSQLKFEPPWEDCADDRPSNPRRLTFNLLKYSHAAVRNDLHISFIPILVDRGVSRDVIARLMTDRLDDDRKELLDMVSDSVKLYNWMTKQGAAINDAGNLRWQAALPSSLPEKIKLLLRSGLEPEKSPYLAGSLAKHVRYQQIWIEQKLRAPLGKATFMYGVTDPSGVLKPGEVHIQFSTPFADEYTGTSHRNLNGLEVLLARQPACRRSDIQKVRVVCRPELSHLVDCVVFPTRGEFPLAGKLQGGDYDGDIFWTCWEDCLVEPFKNAPAPMATPDPSEYFIKTDSRKLHQVMDVKNLSTIDKVLKETFKFKTSQSLLGKVTNFHEKVAYQQNRISSSEIDALCDVHDLLVDAPKQAYSFTEQDYDKLTIRKLKCGNPSKPAYKEAMQANAKFKESEGAKPKNFKHKPENVLDYLFFEVFQAHNVQTMEQVKAKLSKDEDDDDELRLPYTQLRATASQHLMTELDNLVASFTTIRNTWNIHFSPDKPPMSSEAYHKALNACYEPFRALMPSSQHAQEPDIAPLLNHYLGPQHPHIWETIRASALYCTFPKKKSSFVWHMAGRELAHLKARLQPGTFDVIAPIFANLKPKPIKTPKPEEEEEEEELSEEEEMDRALERHTGQV